ncbi:MAG: 1-acyl-sn-glycerol-3-phosphate acyltransferase [Rhodospirillales bacterium]|nr:1-acyl-sn-glycerol-3-phosphate acyltransferase [Rhodospirillales bacterium]
MQRLRITAGKLGAPRRRATRSFFGSAARSNDLPETLPGEAETSRDIAARLRGALFRHAASDHCSNLDGLVLAAVLSGEPVFVAKRELAQQFVAGPFLRALGAIFVDRLAPRNRGRGRSTGRCGRPDRKALRLLSGRILHVGARATPLPHGRLRGSGRSRVTEPAGRDPGDPVDPALRSLASPTRPYRRASGTAARARRNRLEAAVRLHNQARTELLRHCRDPISAAVDRRGTEGAAPVRPSIDLTQCAGRPARLPTGLLSTYLLTYLPDTRK